MTVPAGAAEYGEDVVIDPLVRDEDIYGSHGG